MTSTGPNREHVSRETADIRGEQIEQLKELFPEVVTEGKVDFDKLRTTLGDEVDESPERYTFTWAGKREATRLLQMPSRATLVPVPEESVNFDDTGHLFIEGDNLEVLKLLHKPYFGQVNMVYIDPPFNTGNDFIYRDNFADPLGTYLLLTGQKGADGNLLTTNPETGGRYHSSWLSMMYPRLFRARHLLREDGVVFVSSDDHEVYNLRRLMNDVFGEENFIAQFVWNTEGHTENQYHVKVNHEYVVAYARNASAASMGYVVDPNTRKESKLWKGYAENSITKNGAGNPPSEVTLPVGFPCVVDSLDLPPSDLSPEFFSAVKTQGYITRGITKSFGVTYPVRKDRMVCEAGRLTKECRVYSGWANVNKLKAFIDNECRPMRDDEGNTVSFYLSQRGVIYYRKDREKARHILSVLRNMGTTEQMRSELERMGIVFQYPKPKELLKYLIKVGLHETGLVVDFFAGSCTTAQAVLELNREDGGNRRFIMVQLPEPTGNNDSPTIADIGKERIRCVIATMNEKNQGKPRLDDGETTEDLGFRVFKLAESNYTGWAGVEQADPEAYAAQMKLYADPLVSDWKPENVIYEVAIKEGYGLALRVEKEPGIEGNTVYRVTDPDQEQSFHICLDGALSKDVVKSLPLTAEDLFVCRDVALDDELAANLALQCRLKTI